MSDPILAMSNVKLYRDKRCVLDIEHLEVKRGELVALTGQNGAGKSTLLEAVNLLLPIKCGIIKLFGCDYRQTDPLALRRRTAMVFQETLLLNMSVFNNVALGLKFRKLPMSVVETKVMAALNVFQCSHLAERPATELSGGEAQRVCLARALVTEPELLYLDEPFAALDFATRTALLSELRQIARERGMTVILVSHQFADILYFADRAIVLENGRIVQNAQPAEVLRRPVNRTVAALVGMDNIFNCRAVGTANGYHVMLDNGLEFVVSNPQAQQATACCLPGDALQLWGEQAAYRLNAGAKLQGIVEQIVPGIGISRLTVNVNGLKFVAQLARDRLPEKIAAGSTITLTFDPDEAHFI